MKLLLLTACTTAFVVPAPRFAGVRPQTTSPRKLLTPLRAADDPEALLAQAALTERGVPADGEARTRALADSEEALFYDSKLQTARFFVFQLLPENRMRAAQIMSDDSSALNVVL